MPQKIFRRSRVIYYFKALVVVIKNLQKNCIEKQVEIFKFWSFFSSRKTSEQVCNTELSFTIAKFIDFFCKFASYIFFKYAFCSLIMERTYLLEFCAQPPIARQTKNTTFSEKKTIIRFYFLNFCGLNFL